MGIEDGLGTKSAALDVFQGIQGRER